jgi:adenosine kinase
MGMGNPLLDISANVNEEMLQKYDVKLDTAILAEEKHLPIYTELIEQYSETVQFIAGGATQNTCRVVQWMLHSVETDNGSTNLPKKSVAFMGCIGANDTYGQTLTDCATSDGVVVNYQYSTEHPTGTCAALIVQGERALIANLGAANHFTKPHLTDNATSQEIITSAQIYYCAGFFLTVSLESLVYVAEHTLGDSEKIFALNLSAPFIIDFFTEPLNTAIEYADYLFGNESEAETYAKKHALSCTLPDGTYDLQQVALHIANLSKKNTSRYRTVVFTQGSKPTIVAYNGTVTEYPIIELLEASQIVDTNGAGDAFVGGFFASIIVNGRTNIEAAVNAGHAASKYIIQVSGTQLTTPNTYPLKLAA